MLKEQGTKLKERRGVVAGGERLASNLYNRPFNLQRNPEAAQKLRAARESGALAGKGESVAGKLQERGTADKLREAKESGTLSEKREQVAGKAKERAPAARPETRELRRPAKAKGQDNVFADKDGNVLRRDNKGNWQQRSNSKWSGPTPEARPTKPAKPALAERPAARPPVDTANLNRQFAARQRGEQRTQQFQRAQSQPPRALAQRAESRPQRPALERAARPSGGDRGGGRAFHGGGGGGGGGLRRRG